MGFVTGLMNGLAKGMGTRLSGGAERHVERLAGQVGWSIAEKRGDVMVIHFADPLIQVREVLVTGSDMGLMLGTCGKGCGPWGKVPAVVLGYLLERYKHLTFGNWFMTNHEGMAQFWCAYFALSAGLTPAIFKEIATGIVREATEFDAMMKKMNLWQSETEETSV